MPGFIEVALLLHVSLVLAAPYSKRYFALKKGGFAAGLVAAALVVANDRNTQWWITWEQAGVLWLLINAGIVTALVAANLSVRTGLLYFRRVYGVIGRGRLPLSAAVPILAASGYEEVIWRQGIQLALGNGPLAIAATTYVFSLAHVSRSQKVRYPRMLDVGAFSLISGVAFAVTGNIGFVILLHFGKNFFLEALRREYDESYRARRCGDRASDATLKSAQALS